MSFGFYLAEILTTFVEGVLLFLTVELFCGKKHSGKANIGWVILLSVVYTVVLLVLNEVDRLSILTLFVAILSGACLSVFIVPKKFAYRLLITSHYALVIVIVDSVVSTLVGGILSNPELPFHFIFSEGIGRTIYICGIKVSEVAMFILLRRKLKQVPTFSLSTLVFSLLLSVVAFLNVNYTFNAVLSMSVQKMQISLALAWVSMLASVILIQFLFSFKAKQKEKEQENEMLQSVNAMIEKNYENLERSYLENAKNIHDFRHHVMALDELLTEGEFEEAQGYIRSLHEAEAHSFSAVITGNAVIDAVLNAHHSSAQASGIDFSVTAQPLPDLTMGSWELSTLFSNLLENAREACEKVKGREPWIEVKISVANRFLLLEIRNTSDSRPEEKEWKTTKREKQGHGLGLLSVEDIVEKYNGSLKCSCSEDGIVEVSVMCETISTITDNN